MLIFGQTLLVLGVVALLEQHPLPTARTEVRKEPPGKPGAIGVSVPNGKDDEG
jgi:hypothetical protein